MVCSRPLITWINMRTAFCKYEQYMSYRGCESTNFKARVKAFQKDTVSAMLKANKLHR
jgi:hypothetical protein